MMWGWGYGGGWGGAVFGAAMMLIFWGGLAWLAVYLFRSLGRSDRGEGPASPGPSAREVLAERFARGEISTQEFTERLRVLDGAPAGGRS